MEKLGLDLDGVLYPFAESVETYCRVNHGYAGTTDNFIRNFHHYWYKYNLEWIMESRDMYYKFIPTKRMMDLLNALGEKYQLFYITAREDDLRPITEKYLRDFKFPQKNNLIHTKQKDVYARLLGLSYFVEDNVANAEKLSKVCMSFLLNRPYNESDTGSFTRINSIYDLERILL